MPSSICLMNSYQDRDCFPRNKSLDCVFCIPCLYSFCSFCTKYGDDFHVVVNNLRKSKEGKCACLGSVLDCETLFSLCSSFTGTGEQDDASF